MKAKKRVLIIIPIIIMILTLSLFYMPIKDGRSLIQEVQYRKKLAGAIQPDNYDKMKIVDARITQRVTGTEKFNTPDGKSVDDGSLVSDMEGNDVSSLDNYIRTFDLIKYSIEVRVDRNENTTTDSDILKGGIIKVRVSVPQNPDNSVPWFVITKDAWMKNIEISDDYSVLTATYQVPDNESIIGGIQELSFTFSTEGYTGEIPNNMKPTFEIWMEGNKPDNENSSIDKKTINDNEVLYASGKQNYKLELMNGLINRSSNLNGVSGQYISFATKLDFPLEYKGTEYPYKGIKSKIKLEYYYSDPSSNTGWIKLDRNNEDDRRILDGIKLVAAGIICEETEGFWPSSASNKLSIDCFYRGIESEGSWYANSQFNSNSGDVTATYDNDILTFNNVNNYFYGYNFSGIRNFIVDGFELFIPYKTGVNSGYEYQVRLVDDDLKGYNYQNEEADVPVNSKLTIDFITSAKGNITGLVERTGCAGCSTTAVPVNKTAGFHSYAYGIDGPYEGGEERLIVWTSSLASLARETTGNGYYGINYSIDDGITNLDNLQISYGVYKNNVANGIPTNELTNAAVYEDFYWFDTYDAANAAGTISAMHFNNPDYRGYGLRLDISFHLKGKNNLENIGRVGIIRHKIKLYKDRDRTEAFSFGYNENYKPSVIDEQGKVSSSGRPSSIGHSFVISALVLDVKIIPRSVITGERQTQYNVQDKYISMELKPTVTNLIDEDFNTNFTYSTRLGKYIRYREGSANIEPTRIVENSIYNGQTLYWDLENINVKDVPTITFQVEMSPFTPNNYNTSPAPDAYLESPAYPTADGFDRVALDITNLSGSTIRKNINKDILEPAESFQITDTFYNISDAALQNVKTFEVLPKNNDSNGSKFHGTYTIKVLELSEGQKIYYTTENINSLGLTEDEDGNLTLKNVTLQDNPKWIEVEKNGIIPANATAIGSTIPQIETMSTRSHKYEIIPSGNDYGDKYIFKSLGTSENLTTTVKSDILRASIVSRNIEGKVYIDINRNNKYDTNDSLVPNHQIKLLDNNHQVVDTTTTDNDGKYIFSNLPKGKYYINFGQKDNYNIIPKGTNSTANNDGLTDLITELDKIPTKTEITISNIDVGYTKKTATLTIRYLEKGTNQELSTPVIQTVYYTDQYNTSEANNIPNKYRLDSIDGDPATGVVGKDNIEVKYYYVLKDSTLTIKYVDQDGNDIDPSKNTINAPKHWGDSYTSEQLTFTNYTFDKRTGDAASGTIAKDRVEVIYHYNIKPATLTIKYVDQDGNDIDSSKNTINAPKHWGDTYSSEQLTFTNYTFDKRTGDPASGTIAKDRVEVIYHYNIKPATLTIKYVDQDGANIDPSKNTINAPKFWGDEYTSTQLTFTNYTFDKRTGDPASGTIAKDHIEVIYHYQIKPATLIVKYVDQDNHDIDPTKNRNENIHWGDTYTTTQHSFTNYRFVNITGGPQNGTITADTVEIVYHYELKPATLTIKYVDQDGNDIDPSKNTINAPKHWGDSYTSEQLTFTNYTFDKRTGDQPNGTIAADHVEVIYHYIIKDGTLVVKYVDENGNNIDATKNRNESVHWGDEYSSEQLSFDNYRFVKVSGDPVSGTISKNQTVITYEYELRPSVITVHHYAINSETPIAPDETINKKYTESYSTHQVDTTNLDYEYDSISGDEPSGTISKETYEIIYYYKLKKGKVITHHYLYDGRETDTQLAPDVEDTYDYRSTYTTDTSNKVGKNYEFYSKTDNFTGTIKSPLVEVSYYYQLKDSSLESNISITGPEEITDKNKKVDYQIKYNASIQEYIGTGKVVITNTLPYAIDVDNSNLNGGSYNPNTKTITWIENYSDINSYEQTNNTITIEKNISLKYVGINGRDRVMVSNAKGNITLSNSSRENTDSAPTNIKISGKIIVKYVDTDNKEIAPQIETTNLVGESYVSSPIEKEGYVLIEKPTSEEVEYEEELQELIYTYKRKAFQITTVAKDGGNITGDEIVFYGDDSTPENIIIKAKEGYVIESVTINGEKIDIKPNQQQLVLGQIHEVKEDQLIEVSFAPMSSNPETKSSLPVLSIVIATITAFITIVFTSIYKFGAPKKTR